MRLSSNLFHKYHIVDQSPWPLMSSLSALTLAGGLAMYMHGYQYGLLMLFIGMFAVIGGMFVWWRDVIREGTYLGMHTKVVQTGLRIGMLVFIASEVMFFSAFFWGYFHSSLAPTLELGGIWPPVGIVPFDAAGVPFLNTYILVLSGVTVTYAHHYMIVGDYKKMIEGFVDTIILAVLFTMLQFLEYIEAPFNISDSVYGSTFFMATGFHGFHVIIGTTFLAVCLLRAIKYEFTRQHHVGFEAAAWYWHFVDVVWLFLFLSVYIWGSM
jgi:cytochrome c oxidase subunit 3